MSSIIYFQYKNKEGNFTYVEDGDTLMAGDGDALGDVKATQKKLTESGVDALLILSKENSKWFLIFSSEAGLVSQRISRRLADTIVRSGYVLPSGERVTANYELEELTEANIGDLWKSVQDKYLPDVDLRGMNQEE